MGSLAAEARRAEAAGADALHLDIMDGHFVPNISFGSAVVAMARKATRLPLNVHLMLTRPDRYIDAFAKAGADAILIHVEASCDVAATLADIRARKLSAGIVLNPETSPEALRPFLGGFDEVLCMTVHPGYGGQSFLESVLPHIHAVRALVGTDMTLMVDGGIDATTIGKAAQSGANAFVAGNALYPVRNMAAEIERLRTEAMTGYRALA